MLLESGSKTKHCPIRGEKIIAFPGNFPFVSGGLKINAFKDWLDGDCFFLQANGLDHTSPGQRTGYARVTISRAL